MKELSIEEKAKAYDESIGKIADAVEAGTVEQGFANWLFPELKESEDEQHRKWILEYLYDGLRKSDEQFKGQFKCAIAWLEAQGEHANFISKIQVGDKVTRNKDGVLVNLSQLKRVAKPTDKVEPKFKVGDKIQYLKGYGTIMTIEKIENGEYIFANNMGHTTVESGNKWYLVEQKPAWSEEDEAMLQAYLHTLQTNSITGKVDTIMTIWLKSLKDRMKGE